MGRTDNAPGAVAAAASAAACCATGWSAVYGSSWPGVAAHTPTPLHTSSVRSSPPRLRHAMVPPGPAPPATEILPGGLAGGKRVEHAEHRAP